MRTPILIFVLAFLISFFIFDVYKITSSSMQPNIVPGDHVLGLRFGKPNRSDVVAVKVPVEDEIYIKRIVAMPGETVVFKAGELIVNGNGLKKNYTDNKSVYKYIDSADVVFEEFDGSKKYYVAHSNVVRTRDMEKEQVCGNGTYFLMGDNRTNSEDSRKWGGVDGVNILSRVVIVLYSTDPETGKVRLDRFFKQID